MRLGSINNCIAWIQHQKQMGSICISSAPILRCISLTQTENIALIIPVALEFATSSSFLFFKQGFGGWVFVFMIFFCFLLFRIQETLAVVGRGMGLFHSCNARASFGPSSYVSSQSITIPCLWYGHRYPFVYPVASSQITDCGFNQELHLSYLSSCTLYSFTSSQEGSSSKTFPLMWRLLPRWPYSFPYLQLSPQMK